MFDTIASHTFLARFPLEGPIVIDLGAHRGEFSKEMHARYGGEYYLVEANPALGEQLRAEGLFPVWQAAVTDVDGFAEFNVAHNPTGSSVLTLPSQSAWDCVLRETVRVPALRLESLLAEIRAPRIDLLKVDIEGAEVLVLQTLAKSTLQSIGQITVEFHSKEIFGFDLARRVEDVIRRIRRSGFVFLDFTGSSRLDVLFINRAVHPISWTTGRLWEVRTNPPDWLTDGWKKVPPTIRQHLRKILDRATGATGSNGTAS